MSGWSSERINFISNTMASWISRQTTSKFQQMDKLHDTGGEEEFSNDFPLDGLADSLDNPRLYHCSPGPCDANNNIKMRDPLLCLGSVPAFLTHQPTTCVDGGHVDKSNIVYHTMASQSNLSAANSAQTSSITQSDWSNIITTVNFGQFYDTPFQYVLNAATTPCSKISDESLTYLNQGQSYELKLKKIGEASYAEQYFMSIVRVIFHERRLQYMEKEQLDTWKQTRPGERILDIDIPLSYGLVDVKIDPEQLSCLHFVWDSNRESSGVYIKLNAISTEFTAKRHGGEKGVPFRIQVETYALPSSYVQPHSSSSASFSTFSDISTKLVHCGSCQVKVFKPKGADRKYKTDREKIEKKSESEKEKYQPSFDYTVLTEIPLDQVRSYLEQQSGLNKPSVTSTSVDCNVSPPSTHFHPLKQPTHSHPFTQDAFFPQTCNEAVVLGSPSYHLLGSNISGPRPSHHMEDNVFHDHNGSLQSSINDFQRIQQLYHQPNNNNNDNNNNNINNNINNNNNNNNNVVVVPTSEQETNFMNCFSYNDIHKSPPSPVRNRSVSRLHESNECTVSVITPSNNPRSPAGGEVKRVIYSPYTSTRLTSIHTPSLLQCQIRSPASPNISMDGFKKKDEALQATSSTSLPTSPVIQKSDATSPLGQTHSPTPDPSNGGHLMPPAVQSFKTMGDQVIPSMESIQVEQWLARNRFDNCIDHFRDFTGADLLRLTRDDLIQICGVVNGIRLNNALHSKPIRPKLTLYVAAIGKLAERKVVPGGHRELRSNLELTSSDSSSSSSSSSSSLHIEDIQKNRKGLKRSRTPDINRLENISGRDDNDVGGHDDDDEVTDSLIEKQTKKRKESSDFVEDGDSEVHAVFMETVTIENLVLKLCSIFLLNPNQIKYVYMKKDGDRMNVIVNDLVLQNLSDGLKLGIDIRDHVQGSMSLQLISMN